jgi:Tyrosyl-DNA phosphodiesterase
MSVFGLDRKKMEQERLARLEHRRKRAQSGSNREIVEETEPSTKRQKVDFRTTQSLRSTATTRISPPLRPSSRGVPKKTAIKNGQITPVHSTIQYPNGTIKRTYARYHERENDIKIEEVLLKEQLRLAVLSSFQWDNEWLATKVDFLKTKVVLAAAAKTEEDRDAMTAEANAHKGAGIHMCFPPMEGEVHCMHSKLMLLSYPDSMRIVVPSANLVPYDWGETGIMENSVFLIDLPRLEEPSSRDDLTYFGKELLYFLERSKMPDFVIRGILNFDFSATENIGFVHSV